MPSCFKASENEFLYQRAACCFRKAVAAFETAFDRCVIKDIVPSQVLNDNIFVFWHVRVGDIVLHKPNDTFYANVLGALKQITEGYNLVVLLVGKGQTNGHGTYSVTPDYVASIPHESALAWAESGNRVPHVIAADLTFRDTFVAMMQADVLIGSGTQLPATAALVSGEPLFSITLRSTATTMGRR